MNFWDRNYAAPQYRYGLEPNAFLKEQAYRLGENSDLLLPGDGEGRNGVWLAAQGHRVTSVDSSRIGLEKAKALAARQGVEIETVLADLAEWQPPAGRFSGLVLSYLHLPSSLRAPVHRRLSESLKAGAILIIEAFHPRQLDFTSGGPKDREMLYTLADLRSDFSVDVEEISGEEAETWLDEGEGHSGRAFVTRWIGRRG